MRTTFLRHRRPPRGGISLTEVLISTGVLALGLLGVAALFPVGGHYLRQAEVSDRADAIAQAAINDAAALGMLDPENWLTIRRGSTSIPWISVYDTSFSDSLASQLWQRSAALSSSVEEDRIVANRAINLNVGSIFVIDPLGVAETMTTTPGATATGPAGLMSGAIGYLPAAHTPGGAGAFGSNLDQTVAGWAPWQGADNWPVRRLTVTTGAVRIPRRPVSPMPEQARRMVVSTDDLAIEFGDEADKPSQQRWDGYKIDASDEDEPRKSFQRQAKQEFSWMLTIVPSTTAARNALASDPGSFNYDVSAVVYYKRATGGTLDSNDDDFYGHDSIMLGERQTRAAVASTGIGGGQLRLFTGTAGELDGPRDAESPVENLKAGQWLMLFGPHTESSSTEPLLFCQWYKVVAVEGLDDSDNDADGDSRPDPFVFVRGPDWPWQPGGDQTDASTGIQNDLRMVIVPDVAAVHTRTVKLSAGAAWGID